MTYFDTFKIYFGNKFIKEKNYPKSLVKNSKSLKNSLIKKLKIVLAIDTTKIAHVKKT